MLAEIIEYLTLDKEVFIDIKGYEGLYQISNHGRVYGIKRGYILRPHKNGKYSHVQVELRKNGLSKRFYLHRLVLSHFNREPLNLEECRHKDGNPSNNHISNLEWGTRLENMKDRAVHGNTAVGINNGKSKLTEEKVKEIRRLYKTGKYTRKNLASMFNVSTMPIHQIINRLTWKHVD